MPKFNIVVFGGDYAGPEVTAEAVKVSQIWFLRTIRLCWVLSRG